MLELRHISKTFYPGTVHEKTALQDLSLTLQTGDFVTILGSNGAGKSTLFNAVAGGFAVDSGRIVLDGQELTGMPDYKRSKFIGRMFQDPMRGTAPNMTIEENLALAFLRTNGLLSGGQRQALTLLMATVVTPKLLLLDEHTAALDPATAEKVLALTDEIVQSAHITCMMITHNMHSALAHGNRTIMMDHGKIVLDVAGEERAKLTVEDLLDRFRRLSGDELDNDRMLLS